LVKTNNTDNLANERTFLAYLRTSLAFITFGFVVARFSLFAQELAILKKQKVGNLGLSTDFGVAMAMMGVVVAVYGVWRYSQTYRAIIAGAPAPMSPRAAAVIGVTMAVIGVAVAVALFLFK
jgi:putative membrane protein